MKNSGVIYSINGPVVKVKGDSGLKMLEMVYVGNIKLAGEVISIENDYAVVQVYESTTGIKPGEPVYSTGKAMSVLLGPGILNNIFDGIERPLSDIEKASGSFIGRGLTVNNLSFEKKWNTKILLLIGLTERSARAKRLPKHLRLLTGFLCLPVFPALSAMLSRTENIP